MVTAGPASDELTALRSRILRMPEPLAKVAVYYYFDELSHDDIARILRCSRRHVGHLLERLERWIRKQEAASCAS